MEQTGNDLLQVSVSSFAYVKPTPLATGPLVALRAFTWTSYSSTYNECSWPFTLPELSLVSSLP